MNVTLGPEEITVHYEQPGEPVVTEGTLVVDSIGEPKKPPSEGEMKKLRKQYVTVQHPRVLACNHSLDLNRQPTHRNCDNCWFAWFQNHGEVVQQLDEMFTQEGPQLIIQLQGNKFYDKWRRFMSTVAQWKEVEQAPNE